MTAQKTKNITMFFLLCVYQHIPSHIYFNSFIYLSLSFSLSQTVFRIVVLGIWDYIENKVEVSIGVVPSADLDDLFWISVIIRSHFHFGCLFYFFPRCDAQLQKMNLMGFGRLLVTYLNPKCACVCDIIRCLMVLSSCCPWPLWWPPQWPTGPAAPGMPSASSSLYASGGSRE